MYHQLVSIRATPAARDISFAPRCDPTADDVATDKLIISILHLAAEAKGENMSIKSNPITGQ